MNKAEHLGKLWDEATQNGYWKDLTDEELHQIEAMLWAMHEDALSEWTRREMVKARSK